MNVRLPIMRATALINTLIASILQGFFRLKFTLNLISHSCLRFHFFRQKLFSFKKQDFAQIGFFVVHFKISVPKSIDLSKL